MVPASAVTNTIYFVQEAAYGGVRAFMTGNNNTVREIGADKLSRWGGQIDGRLFVRDNAEDFAIDVWNAGASFNRRGILLRGGNNDAFNAIEIRTSNQSKRLTIGGTQSSTFEIKSITNNGLEFGVNNAARLVLNTSGTLDYINPSVADMTNNSLIHRQFADGRYPQTTGSPTGITNVWSGTIAQFNAIPTKSNTTIYFVR